MRRIRIAYDSARRGRAAFGIAVVVALCGAMIPTAAVGQATPDPSPSPTATPTAEPTATSTQSPTPEPTIESSPEPVATPSPEPTFEANPPTVATPAPTPEPTETPGIPTPENGDYIGSNTEDEADPGAYSAHDDSLRATSLSGFRPGNLISDAKMYTSGTMSAKQLQYFFDQKVKSCQSGYTCLKDFRMNTISKSPNSYCSNSYQGARNESAAQIISKVAKACGVSEKVLTVMLQKEQGLVTHTWPSDWRYDIAMGYACPDDAACDRTYMGFQNQMYMAAYQLQRYTKDSYFSWYPVGKSSPVRYHPNASCGSGSVYIENKATAALYYYTPYQPNKAALNAGYGVGDSCSAYGNRNFYNYYTDWFGGTRGTPSAPSGPSVPGAIGEKWRSLGGADGKLGKATSGQKCGIADGGCRQSFANGIIVWSPATGAHFSTGSILAQWKRTSMMYGNHGYPTSDERCGLADGGCYQTFQNAAIFWSPDTGAHSVWGQIMTGWRTVNKEDGSLGYPTSNRRCGLTNGGCYQPFEGGAVYWTKASGSAPVTRAMLSGWSEMGRENGSLGYPERRMRCGLADGGCYQVFQGGATYWSSSSGAHGVADRMIRGWDMKNREGGKLGYPVSSTRCGIKGGGCYQLFEGGKVYWKKGIGSKPIYGSIMNRYQAVGNEHSWLGYPTSRETCGYGDGGCRQQFQHGWIHWTPGKGTRVGT
ncbi:hypothetical protein [Microbacterium karelineae]|uniref:hypothetical protein n=1 Tax=Microbacterium karelineae TaxID=2654283 RepID=UPI0012E9A4E9|nr:hypothetical protein [Microbacterium karelineae]